ncbi:hypothetical protein PINS_up014282 [Pythium insidiosum]|nr:hypothetical protein PINS_up014282 [Pythium insidiosum]
MSSSEWRWSVWDSHDRDWEQELRRHHSRLLQGQGLSETQTIGGDNEKPRVPHIIHHIWLGPRPIPAVCLAWMESWKKMHPSWEHRLWRDTDVSELTLRNQAAFDAAANFGEKSDIARYEILERFGGVYVDVDVECLCAFDALVARFDFIVGVSNTSCVEINNAVIASAPQHPILQRLITKISSDISRRQERAQALAMVGEWGGADIAAVLSRTTSESAMTTIERTGPGLLTRTFMDAIGWSSATDGSRRPGFLSALESDAVVALPIEYLYPVPNSARETPARRDALPQQSMAVHYWLRSWVDGETVPQC